MRCLEVFVFCSTWLSLLAAPAPNWGNVFGAIGAVTGAVGIGFSASQQAQSDTARRTANAITLYDHRDHWGQRWDVKTYPDICFNLPNANDVVSSVDTHDECFILWEHAGCTGSYHVVSPGRGCHYNLDVCGFNDRASSLQRC